MNPLLYRSMRRGATNHFAMLSTRELADRCTFACVGVRNESCHSGQLNDDPMPRFVGLSSRSYHLMTKKCITRLSYQQNLNNNQIRTFNNVAEYHNIADETLHTIQDALEEVIEDNFATDNDDDEIPEVNYANGVLTIYLPPHGTWVINKQTPNEQLWWSSPISGPRRYEYVEERERWVYTRGAGDEGDDNTSIAEGEEDTLGCILVEEIKKLYDCDMDLVA